MRVVLTSNSNSHRTPKSLFHIPHLYTVPQFFVWFQQFLPFIQPSINSHFHVLHIVMYLQPRSVRLLIKTQILSWSNDDPRQAGRWIGCFFSMKSTAEKQRSNWTNKYYKYKGAGTQTLYQIYIYIDNI